VCGQRGNYISMLVWLGGSFGNMYLQATATIIRDLATSVINILIRVRKILFIIY